MRNRTTRIFCRATRNAQFPSISAYARTYSPHLRLRRYALPPVYFCGAYVHTHAALRFLSDAVFPSFSLHFFLSILGSQSQLVVSMYLLFLFSFFFFSCLVLFCVSNLSLATLNRVPMYVCGHRYLPSYYE